MQPHAVANGTGAVPPASSRRILGNSSAGGAGDSPSVIQRVETAQLQLAAIMTRFPDDLRKVILRQPGPDVMVALPIPTILKFLPTGSVKMSLASVVRQAPAGTFGPINVQDKRLVEVPLAEIFKRVSPAILKRRHDQKYTDLAAEGFDLFGDEENPHAVAPRVTVEDPPPAPTPKPQPRVVAPPSGGRGVLQMPPGMVAAPPAGVKAPIPGPSAAPAAKAPQPAPAPPPAPEPIEETQPPLVMGVAEIAGVLGEPFKSELGALGGATISLPTGAVGNGLAKGKVAFAWGQLRSWIQPPAEGASAASDDTEVGLPLRVIAPAFMKHAKGAAPARKNVSLDESIPDLFSGRNEKPAEAPAPAPAPAPEPEAAAEAVSAPEAEAAPEPAAEQAPEAKAEAAPSPAPEVEAPEAPVEAEAKAEESKDDEAKQVEPEAKEADGEATADAAPEAKEASEEKAEDAPEAEAAPAAESAETAEAKSETEAESKDEPAPEAAEPEAAVETPVEAAPEAAVAVAATAAKLPATVGEVFGQPDKASWSPSEIVKTLAARTDVAGSVVALQEGLVIAHQLNEPFKGEVFAAFLPQVFARINQYSGEMKLGSVNELVIQASGSPCAIFRRGQIYFAVLGNSDSELPIHSLRLCADALASQ